TQWIRRMIEFCDWSGLEVRLVYYPPYHSKYNPIEHCWGVLEQKWGGTLLVSLKVILQQALRMSWRGLARPVKRLHGDYPDGVRLTRAQMKPYEKRLKRSPTLPKYDITIEPVQSARQVGSTPISTGRNDLTKSATSGVDELDRAVGEPG